MDNHNDREALESGTNLRFGVSACFHDSAAYLVRDDDIVSAAQEERFTRKKHDPGFPHRAIDYCQKAGEIELRRMSSGWRIVCCTRRIRSRLRETPIGKKNWRWIRCACCTICGLLLEATVPTRLLAELFLSIVCWQRHCPNSPPMHLDSSSLNSYARNNAK